MRRLKLLPFLKHNRAASYTLSAMIMTAVTVALVLAAFIYAYQMLDQQRGISEWEVAKKSILAYNDALENVAWKPGATRSARFAAQYGYLQLIPNANSITISATVNGVARSLSNATYPGMTGIVKYWLSTDYVSFDPNYESYILGNSSSLISSSSDGYGRAVIRQQPGMVSMTLDYRIRAMRTSVILVNGTQTNYVDIWVIKLSMLVPSAWSYVNEFDLQAKTLSVTTASHRFTGVTNQTSVVSVQIGSAPASQVPVTLTVPGTVVYNVVVANVQVNV
ncbi:MAG TPA: hypothetical protein VJ249_02940 [Candidatus Bathyarchaeia archaeon]|nr:hypothetical protein [Candidatus Bathyarchaeia archaeon]